MTIPVLMAFSPTTGPSGVAAFINVGASRTNIDEGGESLNRPILALV